MIDGHLRKLTARQFDMVAGWQLLAAGATRAMVRHAISAGSWRAIHDGVYALTQARLTRQQLWMAATLTTPDSVLSHGSAGALYGFHPFNARFEVVTRPGDGGRHRTSRLLVCRSATLQNDVTRRGGITITTPERTLIDLAAGINPKATGKMFRESIRLKTTTASRLQAALDRHRGRRGTALLRELATRYAGLPYRRSRSDAESLALELVYDGGFPVPVLNSEIEGEEADLPWPREALFDQPEAFIQLVRWATSG